METKHLLENRKKGLFICSGLLGISLFVASFANPLLKLDVYRSVTNSVFGGTEKHFYVISEADTQKPFGMDKGAIKVASVRCDYKVEKLMLLASGLCLTVISLLVGEEVITKDELINEVKTLQNEGQKKILLDRIKHTIAISSQAQQLEQRSILKELINSFDFETTDEADESLENKFVNASYMESEGYSINKVIKDIWGLEPDTQEFDNVRKKYEEWKDKDE